MNYTHTCRRTRVYTHFIHTYLLVDTCGTPEVIAKALTYMMWKARTLSPNSVLMFSMYNLSKSTFDFTFKYFPSLFTSVSPHQLYPKPNICYDLIDICNWWTLLLSAAVLNISLLCFSFYQLFSM